jgi:hypothetical protein
MCLMPFQQFSSYIMAVNFNSGETRVPVKNHQPVVNHWQTLTQQVVSITPRTHNSIEWLYTLIVCVNVNLTIMGITVFSIPIRYLIGYTVEDIICSSCSNLEL